MEKSVTPVTPAAAESAPEPMVGRILRIAAYPISLAMGYWFAAASAFTAVYDNLLYSKGIDDIRQDVTIKAEAKGRELARQAQKGVTLDYHGKTREVFEPFEQKLQTRLKRFSLDTLPKQWRSLQKHQKHQVIVSGFSAAGISLGVLLTIASSKTFANVFGNHTSENKGDRNNPSTEGVQHVVSVEPMQERSVDNQNINTLSR